MPIYKWRRCMAGFPPIPYKADIIADYFSVDSTWNIAKTKNIPSIFNGVETDGVETVTSSTTYDAKYWTTNAANERISIDGGDTIVLGKNIDFEIEFIYKRIGTYTGDRIYIADVFPHTGVSGHIQVQSGRYLYAYDDSGNFLLNGNLGTNDTINVEYIVKITNVAGASSCTITRTPTAGGATLSDTVSWLGTGEITAGALMLNDSTNKSQFKYLSISDIATPIFVRWVGSNFSDRLGNYAVSNVGSTADTVYSVTETTTVNTYALMASRLVAEGDGVSAYAVAPTVVTGYPFTVAVKVIPTSIIGNSCLFDIADSAETDTNFSILMSAAKLYMFVRQGGTTYIADTDVCGGDIFVNDTPITLIVEYLSATVVNAWCGDLVTTHNPTLLVSPIATPAVDRIGLFAQVDSTPSSYSDDCLTWVGQFNRALTVTEKQSIMDSENPELALTATDSVYSLEGNVYDTSGNGSHLTNSGVDLTATHEDITNGTYSYNLNNGFDLYYDTATGLIPLYVPYLNGSPVVTSVASYTLDSEHPALEKGHNMADVAVLYSTGLTGNIMDKSNTLLWSDLARSGTGYDSSNPTLWQPYELTPENIQLWWVGTKNKIYTISQLNEYIYYNGVASWDTTNGELDTYPEESTTQEGVLIYGTAKTEAEAVKIGKYIKRKIGE